jgi:uncharacterized protein
MIDYNGARKFLIAKLKKELDKRFVYHGVHHTLDVLDAAGRLGELENLSAEDLVLLKTAALFHDCGFLSLYKNHEDESVRITREELPRYGYDSASIEKIATLIMATKIPQSPKNHLSKILCDADLDYLGRDDFIPNANTLFEELKTMGYIEDDEKAWNHIQLSFLNKHAYFTKSAKKLRYKKKLEQVERIKKIIDSYSEDI